MMCYGQSNEYGFLVPIERNIPESRDHDPLVTLLWIRMLFDRKTSAKTKQRHALENCFLVNEGLSQ